MRERFAVVAITVLMPVIIFAGGRSDETPTIRMLVEDVPENTIIAELIPEFEAASGIKVEREVVQYSDMHAKLITQFLANTSQYDVIQVDNYWAGEFPAAGWLEPLEPYIRESGFDTSVYIPAMMDMVGYYPINGMDRELYMLPMYNYTMALIYRTDIMQDPDLQNAYEAEFGERMGVPDDVEEYVTMSIFIQENTDLFGSAMQAARGDPVVMEWSNYLFGLGGDFYDENWKSTINTPEALKAVALYKENLEKGAPIGAKAYNLDDSLRVMSQGEAFSMITYNWMMAQLNNPERSRIAGNVAIAPMPGDNSLAGGWGWGIARNSAGKDAAWRFIEWIESPQIAKRRALMGGAPTRTDVLRDPEVLQQYPYYSVVEEILDNSKPVPEFEYSTQMIEVLGRELSLIMADDKDPKTALDQAFKELETIADDAGLR